MRPAHDTRTALVGVLSAGTEGDFDALASHAGIAPSDAQVTLANLRREGKVVVRRTFVPASPALRGLRGRPRVVYALADRHTRDAHHLALSQALAAWRSPGAEILQQMPKKLIKGVSHDPT